MHRSKEPQNIFELRQDAPPALVAICQKMMAKAPGDRYQTAEEVAEVLQSWLDGKASRTLAMMAIRPPRAPSTAPKANAEEEEEEDLTLAPLDDDPTPRAKAEGSGIKKAQPSADANSPASKDSAAVNPADPHSDAKQGSVHEVPEETELPESSSFESLEEGTPELGGLLDELTTPTASGFDFPTAGFPSFRGAAPKNAVDTFPRWLLIVAGIALVGVIAMIVSLVVTSSR